MKLIRELQDLRSESSWDRYLRIKTTGRDDSNADDNRYPYEPTPYSVLQRLAETGMITKRDTLLDYGCGKGRVSFFMAHETGCRTLGVEINTRLYEKALKNRETAVSGMKTAFFRDDAALFTVPEQVNRAFFFNPFSVKVLRPVMDRIRHSWYNEPREILLFFYFPALEYTGFLMQEETLAFEDEIDTSDLFYENQAREKILIFRME